MSEDNKDTKKGDDDDDDSARELEARVRALAGSRNRAESRGDPRRYKRNSSTTSRKQSGSGLAAGHRSRRELHSSSDYRSRREGYSSGKQSLSTTLDILPDMAGTPAGTTTAGISGGTTTAARTGGTITWDSLASLTPEVLSPGGRIPDPAEERERDETPVLEGGTKVASGGDDHKTTYLGDQGGKRQRNRVLVPFFAFLILLTFRILTKGEEIEGSKMRLTTGVRRRVDSLPGHFNENSLS